VCVVCVCVCECVCACMCTLYVCMRICALACLHLLMRVNVSVHLRRVCIGNESNKDMSRVYVCECECAPEKGKYWQ
jgi:hypothetical protein